MDSTVNFFYVTGLVYCRCVRFQKWSLVPFYGIDVATMMNFTYIGQGMTLIFLLQNTVMQMSLLIFNGKCEG